MTLPTGRHSSSRKAFRYHRTLRLRSFWDFFSATLRKRVVGRPASFGALSALRDYFAVLLASSEATLAYFDLGCLDCVEGGQITVPVTVLSEVRFAPVRIEFDQPIIESSATNQKQALAIDVTGADEITALNVGATGSTGIIAWHVTNSAGTTTKIDFHMPTIERFQTYSYQVFVQSTKPVTRQICDSWSQQIQVTFE
jgi:hypothetical protein